VALLHDVVEVGIVIGELLAEVVNGAFLRFVEDVVSPLYLLRDVKG